MVIASFTANGFNYNSNKDEAELTSACINSAIKNTNYNNYEILIINNNSEKKETELYLKKVSDKYTNIRIYNYPGEFNFSAINNFAAEKAVGKILVFMNNDIEIISNNWLEEMVSLALRPEIGCVGAKLYYPDDTIQHAGIVLGVGGVAGHSHKYMRRNSKGYFNYLQLTRTVSAVTAALLVVEKVFDSVGGFNETELKIAFNDVDLCLKIMQAGYRNIFTPFVEAYHHESKSRGDDQTGQNTLRFKGEFKYMRAVWRDLLDSDPFYSINLTKSREDFSYSGESEK